MLIKIANKLNHLWQLFIAWHPIGFKILKSIFLRKCYYNCENRTNIIVTLLASFLKTLYYLISPALSALSRSPWGNLPVLGPASSRSLRPSTKGRLRSQPPVAYTYIQLCYDKGEGFVKRLFQQSPSTHCCKEWKVKKRSLKSKQQEQDGQPTNTYHTEQR